MNGSVFDYHIRSSLLGPFNPRNGNIITIMDITDNEKGPNTTYRKYTVHCLLIDNIMDPLYSISDYAELKIEG